MRFAEYNGSAARDPDVDPRTGILRNKVGAQTQEELDRAKAALLGARVLQLLEQPAPRPDASGYSLILRMLEIHKHLLQDLFDWAGKLREFDMSVPYGLDAFIARISGNDPPSGYGPRADGTRYLRPGRIPEKTLELESRLRAVDWFRAPPDASDEFRNEKLCRNATELFRTLLYYRLFRGGNWPVYCVLVSELARDAGCGFDWREVPQLSHDIARIMTMRARRGRIVHERRLMEANFRQMNSGRRGDRYLVSDQARRAEAARLNIGSLPSPGPQGGPPDTGGGPGGGPAGGPAGGRAPGDASPRGSDGGRSDGGGASPRVIWPGESGPRARRAAKAGLDAASRPTRRSPGRSGDAHGQAGRPGVGR